MATATIKSYFLSIIFFWKPNSHGRTISEKIKLLLFRKEQQLLFLFSLSLCWFLNSFIGFFFFFFSICLMEFCTSFHSFPSLSVYFSVCYGSRLVCVHLSLSFLWWFPFHLIFWKEIVLQRGFLQPKKTSANDSSRDGGFFRSKIILFCFSFLLLFLRKHLLNEKNPHPIFCRLLSKQFSQTSTKQFTNWTDQ